VLVRVDIQAPAPLPILHSDERDFAMLSLLLQALLPQIGGLVLMVSRSR